MGTRQRLTTFMTARSTWVAVAAAVVLTASVVAVVAVDDDDNGDRARATAATGTTAPVPDVSTTVPASGEVDASTTPTAPVGSPGPGVGGASSPQATTTTTTTAGAAGTQGAGPARLAKGVTDDTIALGFIDASDVGAANQAVGGSSARAGETPRKSYGQPLIDWFNKHGGVASRRIVPVWADVKVTPNNTTAANRQAVCATFTQDNKVYAAQAFSAVLYPDTLECMRRAGTLVMGSALFNYSLDDQAFRMWPSVYMPFSLGLDRMMRLEVAALAGAGYFDRDGRLGVVRYRSEAAQRAVETVLKPALKARGVTVEEEAAVTPTESVDSFAQTQAEMQSVVLRFRAAGISHVLFAIGSQGFASRSFATVAEQQSYRPRYAFNSGENPGAVPGSEPNPQYERSVLVSWSSWDRGWEDGPSKSPRGRECLDILRQEGRPPPRDGLMGQFFVYYCDNLFLMRDALQGVTDFTSTSFGQAMSRLAPWQPAETYSSHLPGGRHDGASAYRVATYQPACGCFNFTTPIRPVSPSGA